MIAPDARGSLLDLKRGTTLNLIDCDPDHPDECPQHYRDSHPLGQAKHVARRWPHGSLSTAADEYLLIGVLARNRFVASPLGLVPHVSASRNIYHCDPVPHLFRINECFENRQPRSRAAQREYPEVRTTWTPGL
jgi:hypothetical protein